MLRNGSLDEMTATRGIEAIERNAKSQAQLIEDLLDVSRIVSGNLRLDIKPIALTSVVKAAMDSIQLAAEAKKIKLKIVVDPVADDVSGDSTRLQQVVWNLLSNSIKFTPHGGEVSVKIDRVDSMAQLSVTDTGEGISAEFLPFVFDRFKQADGSTTRMHGGLGLGLAIARHLMEMHGGTIQADSPGAGMGATFTIRLPLLTRITTPVEPDSNGSLRTSPKSVKAVDVPDIHGIRILIVDDERDAREMLKAGLERFGAIVTIVASAREALDILPTGNPDVLVSDIGMPVQDGYDLIRMIRESPAEMGRDIPAIALTGYVRVEERMRALTAGYQMFVPKPVEVLELATIIANLLETLRKEELANI
jgi:CheY-like chemotaxis protein